MPVVSRVQNGISNETSHHLNVSMIAHQLQNLLSSLPARMFHRNCATAASASIKGKLQEKRHQQTDAQLKENILRFQMVLVNDTDTAEHTLTLLSKSNDRKVVTRVADHPNCPEPVMQELAVHPDAEVRAALAENDKLPESVMILLLTDSDPTVRLTLAGSYSASDRVLACLLDDPNPYVACRAEATLKRRAVKV